MDSAAADDKAGRGTSVGSATDYGVKIKYIGGTDKNGPLFNIKTFTK